MKGEFGDRVETIDLVPSSGGIFEVTAGDSVLYSKRTTGRHAEPGEVVEELRSLLG